MSTFQLKNLTFLRRGEGTMWGGRGALLGATVASCALACFAVVAIIGTLQQAPNRNAELLQEKVLSPAQQRLLPSMESLPPLPGVLASFPSLSSPSSWYPSPAQQHLACFTPRSPCLASLPLQPAPRCRLTLSVSPRRSSTAGSGFPAYRASVWAATTSRSRAACQI